MSIKPMKGPRGQELARCTCADCGTTEEVRAAHGGNSGGSGRPIMSLAKEGQAIRKIEAAGWALVKKKLRCPTCENERKNTNNVTLKPETPMQKPTLKAKPAQSASVTDLRQPTPVQKRQIIGILEDVYDDDRKRYRGQETDKTVAETIGINVMPGWVAAIREDLFGPDGSNDEMETLLAEMREWRVSREKDAHNARIHLEQAEGVLRDIDKAIEQVAAFEKRQVAIIEAVGPKAARA
jgi:hypothetical protein